MRTPNRVAYWTKTRALMAATLTLWSFFIVLVLYFGSPSQSQAEMIEGLSDILNSISSSYFWACFFFFIASILTSWFCGAQDRLDDDNASVARRRGTKL